MMGGPEEFAKIFVYSGVYAEPTTTPTTPTYYSPPPNYYECSKHSWYGDIANHFTCPACDYPTPPSYYECSKHSWSGDIANHFTCPSCELNKNKSCQSCKKTFKFVNVDLLLTVHSSIRKPTESYHNRIIRKYSKGQKKVIYFCSGGCYQSYLTNKTPCIIL